MWHSATDFIGQWHLMRLGLETDRNKPTLTLKCSRNFKCENIWTNSYLETVSLDYKLVSRVWPVRWWWSSRGPTRNLVGVSCYQDRHNILSQRWAWYLLHTLSDTEDWTGPYWPQLAHCTLKTGYTSYTGNTLPTYRNIFMSKCLETLFISSRSWLCVVDKVILTHIVGSV